MKVIRMKSNAVIEDQIEWLEHEIEETASTVENLRRSGGYVPWETEDCQKTTLKLLEEQLRDEKQLLADFQQLLVARGVSDRLA